MRKTVLMVLVLLCIVTVTAAFAEELEAFDSENIVYDNSPAYKLARGVLNMGTCWMEIPSEFTKISREHDPLAGSTVGVAQGVALGVVRGLIGVFDTVTFAIPPYDKPLMLPEFAMKKADDNFKEYLW